MRRENEQRGSRRPSQRIKTLELHQFANTEFETRKFAAVITVLKIFINNLKLKKSSTKRDVYYHDVALFQKSQVFANDIMEIIADSFHFSLENDLNVYPSQKGLIYAELSMQDQGRIWNASEPVLIPRSSSFDILGSPRGIIIIEKDAIFRSFCDYVRSLELNLIIITGKGFPDEKTKRFVQYLSRRFPSVPMLGFMDSDIYGLSILKNFKYTKDFSLNICPQLRLAGVFLLEYSQGWLDISPREWKMMVNFIRDLRRQKAVSIPELKELNVWHREVTRGLILFKKSEMNIIETCPNVYMLKKLSMCIQQST